MRKFLSISLLLITTILLSSCMWGDKKANLDKTPDTKEIINEEKTEKNDESNQEKPQSSTQETPATQDIPAVQETPATQDTPAVQETDNQNVVNIVEENDLQENTKQEVITTKAKWIYTDFSDSKMMNAAWDIVLFFHASWCPSCRTADEKLWWAEITDDITILKVNYDSNNDLKKKYSVSSQHTFVQVDNKWEMIKKWLGSRDLSWIKEKLK